MCKLFYLYFNEIQNLIYIYYNTIGTKLFSLRFKDSDTGITSFGEGPSSASRQSSSSPQKKVSFILLAVFCIVRLLRYL